MTYLERVPVADRTSLVTLSVTVPPAVKQQLTAEAHRRAIPVSRLVTAVLIEVLKRGLED